MESIGERLGKRIKSITERLSSIRATFDDMLSGADDSQMLRARNTDLQLQVSNERKPCDVGPVLAEIDALFEELDDHSLLIDSGSFVQNWRISGSALLTPMFASTPRSFIMRFSVISISTVPDEPETDVGSGSLPTYLMGLSRKQSILARSWLRGRVRNGSLWSFRICSVHRPNSAGTLSHPRSAILRLRCSVRSTLRSYLVLTTSLIYNRFLRHPPHLGGEQLISTLG